MTELMMATILRKHSRLESLLDFGAPVNAVDARRWTALMYAASRDEPEAAELLLRRGADPTLRDIDGLTAYDIASQKGNRDVAAVLRVTETPVAGSST